MNSNAKWVGNVVFFFPPYFAANKKAEIKVKGENSSTNSKSFVPVLANFQLSFFRSCPEIL